MVDRKYGGELDIQKAIELTEEFGLESSLAEQITEFEKEFGDDLKQIDPVAVVIRNAINTAEYEFQDLGVEVTFGQFANFLDCAVLFSFFDSLSCWE